MSDTHPDLGAVFDAHVRHEFEDQSVEATMMTMTRDPYVFNVPTAIGGFGYEGVVGFYRNHFVGKMPADTTVERISRTVGEDQVVDELILKFTHNVPLDSMLPFFWWLAQIFPTTWMIDGARGVILRYASWNELWPHAVVLWCMGLGIFVASMFMFRKQL